MSRKISWNICRAMATLGHFEDDVASVARHLRADQAAAQAKGRERFDSFLQTLGRRLAKGQSVLRELSFDGVNNGIAIRSEMTANAQSSSKEDRR